MAQRTRRCCTVSPSPSPSKPKDRVQCSANHISENLPVGWQTVVEGRFGKVRYTTSDGTTLATHAQAKKYLADKSMSEGARQDILCSLQWNEEGASPESFAKMHGLRRASSRLNPGLLSAREIRDGGQKGAKRSLSSETNKAAAGKGKQSESESRRKGAHRAALGKSEPAGANKRPKWGDEDNDKPKDKGASTGVATKALAIPSYLRSRFGDKGSSIGDAPPTPHVKGGGGAGNSGDDASEGDYDEAVAAMQDERSRRNTATRRRNREGMQADNNILLFGQWYRKRHNIEGELPKKSIPTPGIADLRTFVLDRNAYWGDEIALRVFADAFKIAVVVVLQVEERLQVVFPTRGGAQALFYLVLTHRGAVPHYRSVSVGDRHVLPMLESKNVGCDGIHYITSGMISRLWEDCPHGWEANLSPEALAFFMGRARTKAVTTLRHSVIRNSHTLREVKSEVAIEEQCSAGTAVQSWVIDGFPAGTGFVERIACTPSEVNPCFTVSKTPGDGDCLFYSMIEVTTEVLGLYPSPGPSPEIDSLRKDKNISKFGVTVTKLRQMVSESLTEEELSFFNAANDFC